jgi:hypothetical protein
VALGEATKTIAYLGDVLKAYEFTVRWGGQTTTDDAEGEVIATSDTAPDGGPDHRAAAIHRRYPAGPAAVLGREGRRQPRL